MTATEAPPLAPYIGTPMVRREDARLLTGEAKYVDDIVAPGAVTLAMVRSTMAHARIGSIDSSAALAIAGVRQVLTGADLRDSWAAPMPCAWPVTPDMKNPEHFPVAIDEARYVGDIVAVVVAESRYSAQDGADAVVVDYDPLPAVVDLEDALSDRVLVHESLGTNSSYTWALIPDPDAVEQAFANAAHTVKERYIQQRLIPDAMEPRGVVVVPQPFGGD
ncbi:MAG: aerobic carbon-monoxide dehydrogenase large subunit, partial [Acidimicrobiaceae bacterium]